MSQPGQLPSEAERFSMNTVILAQAIYEGVINLYNKGYKTVDPLIVQIAIATITAFDKDYLIQGFIENSHEECWESIRLRNEDFFIENSGKVFQYLPIEKVNLFRDLVQTKDTNGNSVVPLDLKTSIWYLFHTLVKISIKYIHKGRGPHSYQDKNGQMIGAYTSEFFQEVNLIDHANNWGIKLDFPAAI
jgi:hypothetical protein